MRFPFGTFGSRVLLLAGGTGFGQLLLILVAPVLTRLYTPADFGLLAVFSGLNGIFGVTMALRYEFAVPVARSEYEAAATIVLASLLVLLTSSLAAVGLVVVGEDLVAWAGMPELASVLWLVPPTLLVTSLAQPFDYWSLRRGRIGLNAATRVVQFGGQGLAQLLLGLVGIGGAGMVVGYAAGYVGRLLLFLVALSSEERRYLQMVKHRTLVAVARAGWTYPVYATPTSFLQGVISFLPPILLAAIHDPATAGLFGLAQRLLVVPIRLVATAASQVFLDTAARLDHLALRRLVDRTALRFLGFGTLVMGPVLLAGPWLFALVFGEAWRTAGTMAQLLVLPQLARFVLMPVSQTFNVLGRMDLDLITAVLGAGLLALVFALAVRFSWSPMTTVGMYALVTAAGQLVALLLAWRLARTNRAAARRPGTDD